MVQQYEDHKVQQAHDSVFKESRSVPEQCYPPGMEETQFSEAVQTLKTIVGDEQVYTGESLVHFSDPFSSHSKNFPSAAVCPKSVEEIKKILALANKIHLPLWTTSRGKNLGYGGPSPRVGGSAILSLHRMNQILEVNEKAAYAVVEPGVTFFDLYNYCKDRKLALWPSVPSIAWGSVIGNTLERGFGYTSHGDHHNHICGMEVVLPAGEVIRTGQWAVDDSPSAFACKAGFGPQVDGLFVQSNLGIVTKLGIWVQPQPDTTMSVCLDMDDLEDLDDMIEILGELRRENIIQNDPSIFNVFRPISRLGPRHQVYPNPGAIPEDVLNDMMKEHDWGYWKVWFNFYGTKDMVMSRLAITQETVARRSPCSRLSYKLFEGQDGEKVDPTTIPTEWQPGQAGVPNIKFATTIDYNTPLGGHGGHLDFSPILPYDGKLTLKWYKDVTDISRRHGFDSFVGGHAFAKHSVMIHIILFNRVDRKHVESANALWSDLAAKAKEYGLANYRTHLDYMDTVQESYNFNNNASRRFLESLKDSMDPNGILSPGKSGIWPRAYRDAELGRKPARGVFVKDSNPPVPVKDPKDHGACNGNGESRTVPAKDSNPQAFLENTHEACNGNGESRTVPAKDSNPQAFLENTHEACNGNGEPRTVPEKVSNPQASLENNREACNGNGELGDVGTASARD